MEGQAGQRGVATQDRRRGFSLARLCAISAIILEKDSRFWLAMRRSVSRWRLTAPPGAVRRSSPPLLTMLWVESDCSSSRIGR